MKNKAGKVKAEKCSNGQKKTLAQEQRTMVIEIGCLKQVSGQQDGMALERVLVKRRNSLGWSLRNLLTVRDAKHTCNSRQLKLVP